LATTPRGPEAQIPKRRKHKIIACSDSKLPKRRFYADLSPYRIRRRKSAKPDRTRTHITGIVSRQNHKLIAINNMPDHIHMLVGLRPDASLSDLVRDVKAGSSKFINEKRWMIGRFSWQEGFGAFSYSRSQLGAVIRYIENQQKHNAKKSFRHEYIQLLKKFGVDYDDKYIFKSVD
jgi:REP element-mobilizing transposase RayT